MRFFRILSILGLLTWSQGLFAQDDCATAVTVSDLTGVVCASSAPSATDQLAAGGCEEGTFDTWFEFTAQGSTADITVSNAVGSWNPEFTILSTATNLCEMLFTDEGCYDQNGNYTSITGTITTLVPGNTYWVVVSSGNDNLTGTIDVCVDNPLAAGNCIDNQECVDAEVITLNGPGNAAACLTDCNTGASPGIDFVGNGCEDMLNATVWYEFTVSGATASIDVSLTSADLSDPEFTIFVGNACGPWTILDCTEGAGGSATSAAINVALGQTYVIAISDQTGDMGDFDLCITENPDISACNTNDLLEVTATSMGSPLTGPFQPGEIVTFCYSVTDFQQINCNYLGAFIPEFGDCWDPVSFDAQGQPVNITSPLQSAGVFDFTGPPQPCEGDPTGTWTWFPAGAANYNNITGGYYAANSALPGGWFFMTDYDPGAGCGSTPPTDPDDTFGDSDYPSCGNNTLDWQICFQLQAKGQIACTNGETDCTVSIKTLADAEFGAWTNLGCISDAPETFPASLLCCPIFDAQDTTVCDSFTLPTITGLLLTGNEDYYTGPGGTGTQYSAGTVFNYADFGSYPVTLYIYDGSDPTCVSENSFDLIINQTPTITNAVTTDEFCSGGTTGFVPTADIVGTTFSWTAVGSSGNVTGFSATGTGNITETLTNTGTSVETVTYTVTPTGPGTPGCPGTPVDFVVTVNPVPAITNAVLTEEFCSGGTTGIVPTADVAGTTFDWTAVGSSGNVTGYSATGSGNITETLTNSGTAVETVTYTVTPIGPGTPTCPGTPVDFVVTVNPIPTITNAVTTDEFCSGGTTGFVPTADVAGTTFTWTAAGSSGNVTGFSASGSGNITETLTNSGSAIETVTYTVTPVGPGTPTCPGTPVDFVVTVNPVPTITNAVLTEEFCSGGTTGIVPTADVAGTTFDWTAMGSSGNVTGYSASGSGNITETLTNSGTSVETVTYTITPTANSCPGTPVDFVVTVNAIPTLTVQDSTGCAPLMVNLTDPAYWSTDVGTISYFESDGITPVADPTMLGAGTYILEADNAGCTVTAPVVLTENPTPVIAGTVNPPSACNATDASIDVTLTSGPLTTGSLTWTGTTAGTDPAADLTNPADISGLGAGSYDVTFTDGNGCVSNTISLVIDNPGAPSIDPIAPVVSCTDYTLDLSTVVVTNPGGNLNFYTATGGPSGSGSIIPDLTVLSPQSTTTVFVHDFNGSCSAEVQFTVTLNLVPTLTLQDSTTCSPNTVELSDVTYWSTDVGTMTWYSDAGLSLILPSTNVGAGTYYVEADNAGCTSNGQVTITVNTTPTLTIQDTTVCVGAVIDLTDNTYWSTDVGTLSYFESDGTTPVADPTNVGAGTYVIEADNLGCITTGNVVVSEFAPTVIDGVGTPPSVCNGTDGSIEVTLTSGATSVGTLDWVGTASGSNGAADITLDSPDIATLAAGSYDITFTDANGCISNTVNVVLANPFAPVIDPITNIVSCADQTIDLSTVTGTDLVNPQYYSETGGPAGAGVVIADLTTFTAFTDTTIFVYDANGACTSEVSYTITINTTPTLTLQDSTTCSPNTVDLSDVTYWSTDVGTMTWYSDAGLTTVLPSTTVGDGIYYVEADNAGCTSNGQVTVTVNTTPTLTLQDTTTCSPNTVDLSDATYWSTDVGTMTWYSDAGLTTVLPSTTVGNGTYFVEVDNLGCVSNGQVLVNVTNTPTLTLQDTTDCSPFTVDLSDVNFWSADVGTLTWYSDAGLTTVLPSTSVGAGTYYVEADNLGCTTSGSVVVTEVVTPVVDPLGPITECGSYQLPQITGTGLSGTQSYYAVSGGPGAAGQTVIAEGSVITTTGVIYIYDGASGCFDEEMVDITINTIPTVTAADPAAVCEPNTVDISGAATTDVGTLTWYTDAGLTTPVVDPTAVASGTYYVEADNAGCTSSDMITVTVNPLPQAPTAGNDSTYCTSWTLVNMTASGSGGTLTWYDDQNNVLGTGGSYMPSMTEGVVNYNVTETLNGCEGPASTVTITIETCDITIPTAITPNGDLDNDNWEIIDLDIVYPDNTVRVYNRWGNMIFEHVSSPSAPYDQNRWDGTYDGDALPVGSYYYVIELNDDEGNVETGSVSIILD